VIVAITIAAVIAVAIIAVVKNVAGGNSGKIKIVATNAINVAIVAISMKTEAEMSL